MLLSCDDVWGLFRNLRCYPSHDVAARCDQGFSYTLSQFTVCILQGINLTNTNSSVSRLYRCPVMMYWDYCWLYVAGVEIISLSCDDVLGLMLAVCCWCRGYWLSSSFIYYGPVDLYVCTKQTYIVSLQW